MKTLLLLLTAASLTGCAVYPAPGYEQPSYGAPPYVVEQPGYRHGGVYRSYGQPRAYAPRYYPPPVVVEPPHHRPPPVLVLPRPGRGNGDRDHDGIPDRFDRDRNNDGIADRRPRNGDRNGNGDRDHDGIPDRLERQRENAEIPNLMDRRLSGPGRK
jgi:hypothetical protein